MWYRYAMPVVLELENTASPFTKTAIPPQLAPYTFKRGHAPMGGRPKGSRDAATIYLESLPIKARQWVKDTSAATLIDARKIALPIDSDAVTPSLSIDRLTIIQELQLRGVALPPSLISQSDTPP